MKTVRKKTVRKAATTLKGVKAAKTATGKMVGKTSQHPGVKKAMTGVKKKTASPVIIRRSPGGGSEVNIKQFCSRFRMARPELTRLTGFSQRAVDDWARTNAPSPPALRKLKEIRRLFDALAGIMEADYVGEWVKEPNAAFDGSTPLQVIERGESDRLWRMIYQVETGEPL